MEITQIQTNIIKINHTVIEYPSICYAFIHCQNYIFKVYFLQIYNLFF